MVQPPTWLATKYNARTVAAQAELLAEALEARHPGFISVLREDPLDGLSDFSEIQFAVTNDQQSGSCSVLGRYDPAATPPSIAVTWTSRGQTWFSALHELGHHEQQRDFDWLAAMHTIADAMQRRTLEEQLCEAFAAEILLGADIVDRHIGDGVPTAGSIAELVARTHASRAACAVRVLQLLRADGLVMITDLDRKVLFATGNGAAYAPKRGTIQSPDSIVATAAQSGSARSRDSSVMYGSGAQQHGFAGDAVRDGDYVYAVFTTGRPGWAQGAHIPSRMWWSKSEHDCRCGEVFNLGRGQPCTRCGRADECPSCGRCACAPEPDRNRTCTVCFTEWSTARFDGDSSVCEDCAA